MKTTLTPRLTAAIATGIARGFSNATIAVEVARVRERIRERHNELAADVLTGTDADELIATIAGMTAELDGLLVGLRAAARGKQ
jgi:hypothetical protein